MQTTISFNSSLDTCSSTAETDTHTHTDVSQQMRGRSVWHHTWRRHQHSTIRVDSCSEEQTTQQVTPTVSAQSRDNGSRDPMHTVSRPPGVRRSAFYMCMGHNDSSHWIEGRSRLVRNVVGGTSILNRGHFSSDCCCCWSDRQAIHCCKVTWPYAPPPVHAVND